MVSNDFVIVDDTDLIAINRSKKDNESDAILYKDNKGNLHTIELEVCADNDSSITGHGNSFVGERKIDEHSVVLYTSGILTKIVFRKFFVARPTHFISLSGTRDSRFLRFISLLDETKYRTRDLS